MTTILKITVENVSGVLDRIAGLFRHYGWNIDNISAAEVKSGITDIKIIYKSRFVDEQILHKKISKMDYVKKYEICTEESHILLETAVIKISRQNLTDELATCGKIVLEKDDICYVVYTASPEKVRELLGSTDYLDCDRSGGIGIGKTED